MNLAVTLRLRHAMIRAAYAQTLRTWGNGYPGPSAMTASVIGTSTEEVANVVDGAEQHTAAAE